MKVWKGFAAAAAGALLFSAGITHASPTAIAHKKPAHPVKSAATKYYVCTMCHIYLTAAQAKKGGYICPDCGMKLVAVSSVPKGYAKGE